MHPVRVARCIRYKNMDLRDMENIDNVAPVNMCQRYSMKTREYTHPRYPGNTEKKQPSALSQKLQIPKGRNRTHFLL